MRRGGFDLALAGLLTVAACAGSAVAGRAAQPPVPMDALGYAVVAVATLALALRRTRPLVALAVAAVGTFTYLILGYAYGPVLLAFMLAVYSATRYAALRPALWLLAASLVLMVLHLPTSDRSLGWLGAVPVAAWVVVPGALGYSLRLRHDAALRERADVIQQRVSDERLRVAQEVHDIVGHGLAAIKMQADVALHVMARKPDQAEQALQAISRTSQQALGELRATLATVRRGNGDDRAMATGLDGLWSAGLCLVAEESIRQKRPLPVGEIRSDAEVKLVKRLVNSTGYILAIGNINAVRLVDINS